MSSISTNDNLQSLECAYFPITGSDLRQFSKTNVGECFTSKSLSINNIHFQIYIFPNGQTKAQHGYVQFIVKTNKLDSNIRSVIICCKLYCPILHKMFKEVKTLQGNDSIQWLPYQLQLSEYLNAIKTDGITQLDFICAIEILKIRYKTKLLRRQSSTSISMDIIVFQPQSSSVKKNVEIEWRITNEIIHLFTNTQCGKSYYSQDINSMWTICLFPNGSKQKKNGNGELILKLIRLPPEIESIKVSIEVQLQQEQNQYIKQLLPRKTISFSYNESQLQISDVFKNNKLHQFGAFKLKVIIKIKDIKNANGKSISESWSKYGFDEFKSELFECHIDYGQDYLPQTSAYYYGTNAYYSSTDSMIDIAENMSSDEQTIQMLKTHSNKSYDNNSYSSNYKYTQHKIQKEISYSTNSLAAPTFSRNSITAYRRVSQSQSSLMLNKQHQQHKMHIIGEPWETHEAEMKITDVSQNEIEQKDELIESKKIENNTYNNILMNKFEIWLKEQVQKDEYMQKFKENGYANIRHIKFFNDDLLINIGIENKEDRMTILNAADNFKQRQEQFDVLMNKHPILLLPFKKRFKNNGIFTSDDLLKNISKKTDLQKILNLTNDENKLVKIWNIINEFKIHQFEQLLPQFKLLSVLFPQMIHLSNEETCNVLIQQKSISMVTECCDQIKTLNKLLTKPPNAEQISQQISNSNSNSGSGDSSTVQTTSTTMSSQSDYSYSHVGSQQALGVDVTQINHSIDGSSLPSFKTNKWIMNDTNKKNMSNNQNSPLTPPTDEIN